MTEPATPPMPLGWPDNVTTWCTACGVHLAMVTQPLCPVCLDDEVRAAS